MATKLQQIREACIKANPEVMELVFGCEFIEDGRKRLVVGFGKRNPDEVMGVTESGMTSMIYAGGYIKDSCKIIGRPIHLADIVLTWTQSDRAAIEIPSVLTNLVFHWNLENDNLDNQSKKTINFIHSLLI